MVTQAIRGLIAAALTVSLWWNCSHAGAADSTSVGASVEDFQLADTYGRVHRLREDGEIRATVLVFLGVECPLAKLYGPRLADLAAEYESRQVRILGISSNSQDSITELTAYARRHQIGFPLLKDLNNLVADAVGAQRTPEVFVLDRAFVLRYRGRIDDQYGIGYIREQPTQQDLRRALDELLAGHPITQPVTEAVGCLIGRVRSPDPTSPVTYSNQIARIFQQHCVECHRPGEIAPFSLTSYDEAAGWADTIAEVVAAQRMPPWHASAEHGRFVNARLLSEEEKTLIHDWAIAGAPQGEPGQLPEPLEYVQGWRLSRPPDVVVAMRDRPYTVPAEGTVEYQYFVVDPEFTEDKWVQAAEVIPGNRSVVHHAIVFFRAPEGIDQHGLGWLTAYVPGQGSFELPPHQARWVPAGSKLIFQMHYTPTGSPQEDITRIGLLFADESAVTEELITLAAINHEFEIPPQAADHLVEAAIDEFPAGAKLRAIAPHMHVRGKSFRVATRHPDSSQILLDVPQYDFNWQHAYVLQEPLALDGAVRLECQARFDNSDNNLVNPDPSASVRWGDQTWEEMMIAFFEVSVPVDSLRHASVRDDTLTAPQQAQAQREADALLQRFDRDHDGLVRRDETPDAFAAFAFNSFDANRDKVITHGEALAAAERALRRKANGRAP